VLSSITSGEAGVTTVTTEQSDALRERILRELEDREPRVHDVAIGIIIDDETGDESTAVDLTLADPAAGSDTWDLNQLDELAIAIERIVAAEDLPAAVISVTPLSSEEFQDGPKSL
jgi:hypothetical protein